MNLYRAGWRPAVGWLMVLACAYHFLLRPIGNAVLAIAGLPPMEALDITSLMTMLGAIMGMGGLRTAEKIKGIEPTNGPQ